MTTTLYLVRHGQTNSNITGFYMGWSDEELNETGLTQVRHLSSRLTHLSIKSIYTSPLKRACATAGILAEPHGLKPIVFNDLTEVRLGDWQGLHMEEIEQRWPELWYQWRTDPSEVRIPNGESLPKISERAVRAMQKVIEDNLEQQVLIVTHEVIVKVMAIYALGASNSVYRRFEVSNASLTVIEVSNCHFRLTRLNDKSYLEGK